MLIEFLEKNIISKLRNKLIILDNASSHRKLFYYVKVTITKVRWIKTRKIKGKYRKCDNQNTKRKVYKYFQMCL